MKRDRRAPRLSGRLIASAATVLVGFGMLAGCGGDEPPPVGLSASPPPSPVVTTEAPPPATTEAPKPKPTKATPPALTCAAVKDATIGSASLKYNGYDGIPLLDGIWAGEDGNEVEVSICAVGDLDGNGSKDALAAAKLSSVGTTGKFWSLEFWKNVDGEPRYSASKALDDRTPVESIAISANLATVVWLTRGPSDPAIALTIRRTSVFKVSGSTLVELSHTDAPYSG